MLNTLSDFALKILSIYSLTVFSNIARDLFKSIEDLSRSRTVQIGSTAERIIVLGSLRKKCLTRCQILRSKNYLYTV